MTSSSSVESAAPRGRRRAPTSREVRLDGDATRRRPQALDLRRERLDRLLQLPDLGALNSSQIARDCLKLLDLRQVELLEFVRVLLELPQPAQVEAPDLVHLLRKPTPRCPIGFLTPVQFCAQGAPGPDAKIQELMLHVLDLRFTPLPGTCSGRGMTSAVS